MILSRNLNALRQLIVAKVYGPVLLVFVVEFFVTIFDPIAMMGGHIQITIVFPF